MIMARRDREGWLNFMFLGDSRVQHKKERDQRRWVKSSWETGTWGISCASQLPIPDTAGTSPDLASSHTVTRSSKPNQASRSPDFSGPLISSISFSSSSPISLILVHNSTIIARTPSQVIPLYLSMPSLWVNTECGIRCVQHTPSTA